MNSSEIVKSLLLKFKGDSSELQKEAKKIEPILKRLQENAGVFGGGNANQNMKLKKNFDDMGKMLEKVGVPLEKSFKRMQESVKALANVELKNATKELEKMQRLFVKAEERVKAAQGSGDPMLSTKTAARDRIWNRMNEVAGGLPPRGVGGMGRLVTAGSILGIAAQGMQMYADYGVNRQASNAALASEVMRRRQNVYSGSVVDAYMDRQYNMTAKAQAEGKKSAYFGLGSDILKDTAIGAGTGAIFGGGIPGALVGGAVGLIGGTVRAGYRLATGQVAAEATQKAAQYQENMKATAFDAQALARRSAAAGSRYRFQQQMHMTDQEGMNFRTGGATYGLSAEEMMGMGANLYNSLGRRGAADVARASASSYQGLGLSAQTTSELLGATTARTGNAQESKRQLTEVMAAAFSHGITDSGLDEMLAKAVIAAQAQSGSATSAEHLAGLALRGGPGDGSAIGTQALMSGVQFSDQVSMRGGIQGMVKSREINKLLTQMGYTGAQRDLHTSALMEIKGSDWNKNNTFIQGLVNQAPNQDFAQGWQASGGAQKLGDTFSTNMAPSAGLAQAMKRIKAGGTVSESDKNLLRAEAIRQGKNTWEADIIANQEIARLQGDALASGSSAVGSMIDANRGRVGGSVDAALNRAQTQGQAKQDIDDITKTKGVSASTVDSLSKQEDMNTSSAVNMTPNSTAGELQSAVSNLAGAVQRLSSVINSKGMEMGQ